MKKIYCCVVSNWQQFICTILTSIFFSFIVFPKIVSIPRIQSLISSFSLNHAIGFTSLILLPIFLFWKNSQRFWAKYKNNYSLDVAPFVFPDYIAIFLNASALILLFFQGKIISRLAPTFMCFIIFNFFLIIIWFFGTYYSWRKQTKEHVASSQDNKRNLFSDEAINDDRDDCLGRISFVDGVYRQISNLHCKDSFVFGVYGAWGEGKTSVINLLKKRLKDAKEFLVLEFDPWYFKNEEAILAAFYSEIEKTIGERFYLPIIHKELRKYYRMISVGLPGGIKFDFNFNDEKLEQMKQNIEFCLAKQIKKKLLIIIDDIDRLQRDEILAIFKLVRLHAKFKNTIFILAFDPRVVHTRLGEDYLDDFIAKIIQNPISLPAIEQNSMDEFLDRNMHLILQGVFENE